MYSTTTGLEKVFTLVKASRKRTNVNLLVLFVLPVIFTCSSAYAGFVEMPDTTEAPQLQRESMLKDIDIPSVRDRDPDPKAGPRLNVKEFRIQGLVEYPEVGITREKLIKQVEDLRFDMMGEGKQLDSGYTMDELSEVSNLIADIEKNTEGEHVGPVEVQRLVFLIREQRRNRGITLGMIETVADTITRYYREHGFILAKAYIPKQQVRDGVVTLTVLLGELGEVNVQNNKRYSSKLIQNIFNDDLAKPVTNERIEEKLYFVNDLPGYTAQGYFEPGSQVGDTKLNVNTSSERWFDSALRVDNHGSDRSGKNRVYADFTYNNPTGMGDSLHLAVLESFSPSNSTYGEIKYGTSLFSPRINLTLDASSNDFVLGNNADSFGGIGVTGKSNVADASVNYQFKRSRVKNYSAGVKLSSISSRIELSSDVDDGTGALVVPNSVKNTEAYFNFDLLNEKSRMLHQGSVSVVSSKFVKGSQGIQSKSPAYLMYDYSLLTFLNIPFTKTESRVVLKTTGQFSNEALASVNQFSLGGPTRARAYQISEFSADDALYLGADWVFKGPSFHDYKIGGERLGNIIQPFLLIDYSYGRGNPIKEGEVPTKANLVDLGFGLKFEYKGSFRGSLVVADPIRAKITNQNKNKGSSTESSGVNIYFDMQYTF